MWVHYRWNRCLYCGQSCCRLCVRSISLPSRSLRCVDSKALAASTLFTASTFIRSKPVYSSHSCLFDISPCSHFWQQTSKDPCCRLCAVFEPNEWRAEDRSFAQTLLTAPVMFMWVTCLSGPFLDCCSKGSARGRGLQHTSI